MPHSKKGSQPPARIRGFTSLEDHESGQQQDGNVAIRDVEGFRMRRIWHKGEWWHSVIDIVAAMAENSSRPRKYWDDLKRKLTDEGFDQLSEKIGRLRLPAADGKSYATDCATTKTMFRIIESIPSKRAEPIKQYLAAAGAERLKDAADPSRAIDRAITRYREMGRDEEWIDHRLQNISARNELTDEWSNRDVPDTKFGELTNEMSAVAMGLQPTAHAELKGVKPTTLRDHMDKSELAITTVGETAAKAIIVHRDTREYDDTRQASLDGAGVARAARTALEKQLGRSVASSSNFLPRPDGSDTPLFAPSKARKKEEQK